jgi:hypothetical protein
VKAEEGERAGADKPPEEVEAEGAEEEYAA